jgi:hypothetical protein
MNNKRPLIVTIVCAVLGLALGACSNFVTVDRTKVPDDLYHPTPTADAASTADAPSTTDAEADAGQPETEPDAGTDAVTPTDDAAIDGDLPDAIAADGA